MKKDNNKPEVVEYANGTKEWWLNDELHREDGPAIEWVGGGKMWYLNGKRHREDGPAIEYADGDKMWYLNGEELTEEEHAARTNSSNNNKDYKYKDYKYKEDLILKEVEEYVKLTYGQHYSQDRIQATEFIIDSGHGEGFCIGNIIKYAQRYGKKEGKNRKDLLKVIHYAIMALSINEK